MKPVYYAWPERRTYEKSHFSRASSVATPRVIESNAGSLHLTNWKRSASDDLALTPPALLPG
jgi:hypothetical protein